MLLDNTSTINTNHFPTLESLAYQAQSLSIQIGLVICGHQYGTIHHKEVGMGSWQSFDILIKDSTRQRQFYQLIGFAFHGTEGLELLLHLFQVGIVLIGLIIALHLTTLLIAYYQRYITREKEEILADEENSSK